MLFLASLWAAHLKSSLKYHTTMTDNKYSGLMEIFSVNIMSEG